MTFLLTMLGTKGVAALSAVILGLGGFMLALWRTYRAGQSSERSKQAKAEKKAIDTARKVDGEVDRMSGDEARKKLREWGR